jgi:outer membrane lipoprotein-sorting protein
MNCTECKDLLVPYIEQLLDDSRGQMVCEHLSGCASCRREMEGLQTLQGRLVENGKAVAQGDLEDRVMDRIIREQNVRLKSAAQAGAGLRLRRFLMKSTTAKLAAAAVLVVACVVAYAMWRNTASMALADVLAKVEQMQAFFYRERGATHDQTQGDSTTEAAVLSSSQYGARMEQTTVKVADGQQTHTLTYILPQKKSLVIIDLGQKQYTRMALDDAMVETMNKQSRDPREMLKRFLACKYSELGTADIEGVKAQGFETTDPAYLAGIGKNVSAKMWVAVDTWLPVRYELEVDLSEGMHVSAVQDSYQWGVAVDAAEFEPDIPEDFTASPVDGMQAPSFSEQGMIDALQLCADFAQRYPEKLDTDSVQEITKEITASLTTGDSPAAQQFREEARSAGSPLKAGMQAGQRFMKLMTLGMFPLMLAGQGAEPVYHGDIVTPSDATLPLMRWKTADNEYRVIFGDLHAATVTGEELTVLEAALPK